MNVMIKLRLPPDARTFEAVRLLRGLAEVQLDQGYGLVGIDPERNLYIVRGSIPNWVDFQLRKSASKEILEAYPDDPIEPVSEPPVEPGVFY